MNAMSRHQTSRPTQRDGWTACFELACVKARTVVIVAAVVLAATNHASAGSVSDDWIKGISQLIWVAYSPSTGNPLERVEPTADAIKQDLSALRKAGFTGLVTYSCSGVLGNVLPQSAGTEGFKGLIVGVWEPKDAKELAGAKQAAQADIVLGVCVGNEGLGKRYTLEELNAAMDEVRVATGKPVTTTEEIDDYLDDDLLHAGDWVFPNAHPYFHSQLDPAAAVKWTKNAYEDLCRRSDRFVMFKEVGLPTAGDEGGKLSESAQEQYYVDLAKTNVRFVYFEGFDLRWKTHLPVEPHWGLFTSARTPKRLAWRLMEKTPSPVETAKPKEAQTVFYVYRDADSQENHFVPSGYMGDCGDIRINPAWETNPHSGTTCIQVVYAAKGKGPSTAHYPGPAKWAGVYWQYPANNWGKDEAFRDKGFDLSAFNRLKFWARADKLCEIEFKVGGIDEKYGDSLTYPRSRIADIQEEWQEFQIDLEGANLKHIIGGFCWVTNWDTNPGGAVFYLDEVRFEK